VRDLGGWMQILFDLLIPSSIPATVDLGLVLENKLKSQDTNILGDVELDNESSFLKYSNEILQNM